MTEGNQDSKLNKITFMAVGYSGPQKLDSALSHR